MAIEVGGTFTDVIWIDDEDQVRTYKLPSTPHDPSIGLIAGVNATLDDRVSSLSQLFHGSTVATNAILERKGCRAAFLTTRGFRDVLMLQRQLRPNVYAIACRKPEPLVPLSRSIEAMERLDKAGDVIIPLDERDLIAEIEALVAREHPEALAICLLHAYRNPSHEERIKQLIGERYPDLPVVLSSTVLPTFREYERASTTVMAAYLAPLVGRYLARIEDHLAARASPARLHVMQSSGGVLPSAGLQDRGVEMLNSGPAAGVIGATRIAALIGDRDAITLDVGGTSADICLITDGQHGVTSESEVDGLPIGLPSIDIANVGAGGGSLGWIDGGGMLQVGPHSAGARPGPASYGHGGSAPAVTDALVQLGWIRPHRFLGGAMEIYPEKAEAALTTLSAPFGQTTDAIAMDMIEICAAHISRGIRLVSVQRGHDPKDYALYAYGGMDPMMGVLAARELKIRRVVVPPHPGLFSALGLLVADLKRVYRRTSIQPPDGVADQRVAETFASLQATAEAEFSALDRAPAEIHFEHTLEMRFQGQGYEVATPVTLDCLRRKGSEYLIGAFRNEHRARFGANPRGGEIEIVTFRLTARILTSDDVLRKVVGGARNKKSPPEIARGSITFEGGKLDCHFAWRGDLSEGFVVTGPAIIEEPTATTVVAPGWSATVDRSGALVLIDDSAAS